MTTMQPIRLLIADDHKIILDGFCAVIREIPDMEIVATAHDGRSAVYWAKTAKPDAAIIDIGMPELNGIEAARQIKAEVPETQIIALSMYNRRKYIDRMFKAGAKGYVLKHAAFAEIERAVRAVMDGKAYVSPEIAHTMVAGMVAHLESGSDQFSELLTSREREVLQLIAEGLSTQNIAKKLQLSGKTVESHRRRLMGKLNLFTVAELTKYAIREGVTFLDS